MNLLLLIDKYGHDDENVINILGCSIFAQINDREMMHHMNLITYTGLILHSFQRLVQISGIES